MTTIPDTFADAVLAQASRCLSDHKAALDALQLYEDDAENGCLSASELRGFLHGLFVADLLDLLDYSEMVDTLGLEARRAGRATDWT